MHIGKLRDTHDPPPTDADLIAGSGLDEEAFCLLYDRYAEALRAHLSRRCGSDDDALDLLAETFACAWEARGRFTDRGDGSASAWLYGIAGNLVLRRFRDGRVERAACERLGIRSRPQDAGDIETERVLDQLTAASRADDLADALGRMSKTGRDTLLLHVVDDLSYDEIAQLEGTHNQTVRARVSRALRSLSMNVREVRS